MKLNNLKIIILSALISVLSSFFVVSQVSAAPNQGPNPDDYTESGAYGNDWAGWGRRVDYVVATSIYNYIPTTKIKIFMPTSTGQIVIHNKDICYATFRNGGDNYDLPDDGNRNGATGSVVSYNIPGGGATQWGGWNGSGSCDSASLFFNVSGASLDPNTGMYLYELFATANPSAARYMHTFWVTAPAGTIISQDSSLSATSGFGMNQGYPIIRGNNPSSTQFPPAPYRNYTNWSVKFAPDCSVTTPTVTRTIETYDDDNRAASSSDNWAVQPRRFSVRLAEYDRSGNWLAWRNADAIAFPDGGGGSGYFGNGLYEVYTSGSNRRIQMTYTFNRDRIYRWELYNVYQDNTLQFKIPFDNVYYYVPCQLPEAQIRASITPSATKVSHGSSVNITPAVISTGYRGVPLTVNCTVQRTLTPPAGAPVSLGAQSCSSGGNPNIVINGNGTFNLTANTYTPLATHQPGSRVCDLMTITSPADPKYFAAPADRQAQTCVTITKSPLVNFLGGDIYAGGGFLSGGTCPLNLSDIHGVSRTLGSGALAGSWVEYGGYALGEVTTFGSAATPMVGASGRSLVFANTILSGPNAGRLGYLAASSHCMTDFVTPYSNLPATGATTIDLTTASSTYRARHTAGLTVTTSGNLQSGKRQTIYVVGNVNINSNIIFNNGPYTGIGSVPSVRIIATGNITVAPTVTRMDGTFVSLGTFNTCSTGGALTTTTCNQQLVVNGAVIANRLDLRRTYGADGATEAQQRIPGEIFNLTPYTFLSGISEGTQTLKVRTITTRDLPARY